MKKDAKRSNQKKVVTSIMLVLAILFIVTPVFVRSLQGNNALIGEESYLHLALAQNLNGASFPIPPTAINLFDSIVAGLLLVVKSPFIVGILFPLVLGLASLLLLQSKVSSLLSEEKDKTLVILLFIISPLFLIIFSSLNPYTLILFLGLLSWRLFDKYKWASMLALLLLTLIDVKAFVLVAALLVAQGLQEDNEWKLPLIVGIFGSLSVFLVKVFTGYIALDPLMTNSSLQSLLSSFGSDLGYSLFITILAIIGAGSLWSRKKEHVFASLIVVAVFVFSFHELSARVLLMPLFALFASVGIVELFEREWQVKELKDFTLFIIGLALLFTLILTVSSRINERPDLEMMDALLFLQSAPDGDFILSSKENGILIERIARQPAFLDTVRKDPILIEERDLVAKEIFASQRMTTTQELLEANSITHIMIDSAMREGNIWTDDEQGLLFLVKYSPKLVLVYQNKNIEIYRYIKI